MSAPITPERNSRVEWLLEQLIDKVQQEAGTMFHYAGRVDTVDDLPEVGHENDMYFVGLEDAANWDEYIWATDVTTGTGHWDRLGSVTIIVDDHLDAQSTNPVQNAVITLALANKADLTVIGPAYSTSTEYTTGKLVVKDGVLYKFTAAQPYTGEWDATKWTATTISAELEGKLESSVAASTYLTIATAAATYQTIEEAFNPAVIAEDYDPDKTYATGEYMMYQGELYREDAVNGSYIDDRVNLFDPSMKISGTDNKFVHVRKSYDVAYADTSNGYYIAKVNLEQGKTYIISHPSVSSPVGSRGSDYYGCVRTNPEWDIAAHSWVQDAGVNYNVIEYEESGDTTVAVNNSNAYLYLAVYAADENTFYVKEQKTFHSKFVKTDVGTELMNKQAKLVEGVNFDAAPTQNSTNPVQSGGVYTAIHGLVVISNTGDITIDGQLVRKVLTQAEYDLLDPPDEKVDYIIVPAST